MNSIRPHTLTLENLTIGYHNPLLQNISLTLKSGRITGIIGNNGKGKTTLLKSIAGLQKPLFGQILFDDKNIFDLTAQERSKIVSMSFASNYITFPISVFELVSMGRYPYTNHWAGLSDVDEKIISDAIDLCGINDLQNKFVTSLSDGERQKAFIAKTIAQQSPMLLFDEPTAFLDYTSKKQFFSKMMTLAAEQNKIILICSHDIDFLSVYAADLLMIENGEGVLFNSSENIMQTEYFKLYFAKK